MTSSVPPPPVRLRARFARRLVLGTAFLLGLAFAFAPRTPSVHAQEPKIPPARRHRTAPKGSSTSGTVIVTDGKGAQAKIEVRQGGDGADKASATPGDAAVDTDAATAADGKSGSSRHGVIIGKHGRIRSTGSGPTASSTRSASSSTTSRRSPPWSSRSSRSSSLRRCS